MCDIKNEVNGCKNGRGRRTQTLKWVEHVQHVPCVSTMQRAVSKIESGLSRSLLTGYDGILCGWAQAPGPPTITNSDAAAADMSKQNGPHVGVTKDWSVFPFDNEIFTYPLN